MRTFHRFGGLIFIIGNHDNFPNWMMIHIFLPLGEGFYFFIVNQLIMNN